MDLTTVNSILTIGETVAVEFKRCGNGIEPDTYETVCSFLNRFGGDIFLGVLDDGTVSGVPEKRLPRCIFANRIFLQKRRYIHMPQWKICDWIYCREFVLWRRIMQADSIRGLIWMIRNC
ncbi:MAG: ATP-binding protein [Blautia sp.]|nr:ATP-binding protein [Blautia sp.]